MNYAFTVRTNYEAESPETPLRVDLVSRIDLYNIIVPIRHFR